MLGIASFVALSIPACQRGSVVTEQFPGYPHVLAGRTARRLVDTRCQLCFALNPIRSTPLVLNSGSRSGATSTPSPDGHSPPRIARAQVEATSAPTPPIAPRSVPGGFASERSHRIPR